jgi:outer membrane receptor protein involved in Fe transport
MRALFLCSSVLPVAMAVEPVEAMVVSADGSARDPLETPVAIHASDPQRARPAWWIGEALNSLPGVYQAQLRGIIDAPVIRMPLTFKNHHLYLQDGVPLQSTVMFNSKALAYSTATTSDGGIEVLKGPGTALYGSDAMASVVAVNSRRPTEQLGVRGRVAGGTYGARSINAQAMGAIAAGQALGVAAAVDGEDGWRHHDGWQRSQGVMRHHLDHGALRIDTILIATRLDSEMTGQLSPTQYRDDPSNDGLAPSVPLSEATDDATFLRLSSAWSLALAADIELELTPYVREIDNSYLEVFNPATTPRDREHTASAGLLARLRLHPWPGGEVLLGSDVESTRLWYTVEQSRPTTVVDGLTSFQGRHYDFTVDHLGVSPYAQLSQSLGDAWIIDLGLRGDVVRYRYDEHLGPTSDPQDLVYRPEDRNDHFQQLSPKAGAAWLIDGTQALFVRYAHGFRIPSADSLYVLRNGQTGFQLEPETVDAFEVGWKGRMPTLSWEIDAYWSEARDGIVDGVVTAAGTISANGGRRRYRGIETGGTWRITDGVEVAASYARTFHEIVQQRAEGASPQDGNAPASAPGDLADLRLGLAALPSLWLEVEVQWLGSWWMDDANTARTPDELLCHLRAAYHLDRHWCIDGKILNLFDEQYATTAQRFSYGDRFRPGQPFTAVIGVTAGF